MLDEIVCWGKGVMFEAGKMLIDHGFRTLNLHRIYCGISAENVEIQKLAAKLDMSEEGRRKEAISKHGKYTDVIDYAVINHKNLS